MSCFIKNAVRLKQIGEIRWLLISCSGYDESRVICSNARVFEFFHEPKETRSSNEPFSTMLSCIVMMKERVKFSARKEITGN